MEDKKYIREEIINIILAEFSKLISIIEADFVANYNKKVNNFLLSQMDERITASMVFVSSFESKSGFAIESCAKKIARIRYGEINVPSVVNPHNLPHKIKENSLNGQVVLTNVETHNGDLRGKISAFRANNMADGRGKNRVESGVTQDSIKKYLLPLSEEYKSNSIYKKPVDLAFFDGINWNIMELKAGGDLDSSNAPSNVEKLLTIYVDMGIDNCKIYFATLYNKDGEGNTWTGSVKKHLSYPEMFLIGKTFWNKILPPIITFEEFTHIYREALEEIDLNRRINNMLSDCLGEL